MRAGLGRSTVAWSVVFLSFALLAVSTSPTTGADGHVPDPCLGDEDIDGGLVIDRSGSMSGDRLSAAKDGAKLLLDRLDRDDYSGLVSYASSARLDKPLGPDHEATKDAVDRLVAGGGTSTGQGIDRSHQDFQLNARSETRDVMILLSDGYSGDNPVPEAEEAKADGIEIYAIGVGGSVNEQELREIASDPDEQYFHHAQDASEVEEVFLDIAGDVSTNDSKAPQASIEHPEPGHLYVDGVDQGPDTSPFADRAALAGNMSFEASATDNCLPEQIRFETAPTTSWTHTESSADVTTDPFPAETVPAGNYTLFANATDWVGLTGGDETPFTVLDARPPYWVDADAICDRTKRVLANDTISFDLIAKSDNETRAVSLGVSGLPDGASFPIPDPANPVSSTFAWTPDDTQLGEHQVVFSAQDDLGLSAPDCPVTIEVIDDPIYWAEPACGTTLEVPTRQEFALEVTAASLESERLLTLGHDGLPTGASFPIPDPANPVSSTFTWEPSPDQLGDHTVTFTVEDDTGKQGPDCTVTLSVHAPPYWDNPDPVCGTQRTVIAGQPLEVDVRARSDETDRNVTLGVESLPDGASFPIPDPANPVSSTLSWVPSSSRIAEHEIVFTATDELGHAAPDCPLTVDVRTLRGHALSTGLWAGAAVPASLEAETTSVDQAGNGSGRNTHLVVDRPDLNLYAGGIEETGEVDYRVKQGLVTANGTTQLTRVELWDGLVTIEGLQQRANLTWDLHQSEASLETDPRVGTLRIGGETIDLEATDDTLAFPLPGGGELTLFEDHLRVEDHGAFYEETLVHAYLPAPYGREEVILGSLELQARDSPPFLRYGGQNRSIVEQDDAGSGRDAGPGPGSAVAIEEGVHHGSAPAGDELDTYALPLEHGEKVNLALQPAPRAKARAPSLLVEGSTTSTDQSVPNAQTPSTYELRLLDPTGEERETSALTSRGLTERIEFNADIDGTWHLEVRQPRSTAPRAYNYTLATTITPLPLLPADTAGLARDLPDACDPADAAIPTIGTGAWPGVIKHEDQADLYRFHANIGEAINLALKPGETLDGFDAALALYDQHCNLLHRSDMTISLRGTAVPLKGKPENVVETPSQYTGDYFVAVERVNAIGNYYLNLDVVNPQPTLPQNDALSGTDAEASCPAATPAPPALYQGRLYDGDPGDAYRIHFNDNFTAYVAVDMSRTSDIQVQLTKPSGETIGRDVEVREETWLFVFGTDEEGEYCLQIDPENGGGNYLVSHGEVPGFEPLTAG